jgi:uncharacterized protein (TIGR03000 family)
MYSVVLMAALTSGAASEGCCWGHGYGGGCYGGYSGCYGGCYGGYGYGAGYSGCYGGCYGGAWGGGYVASGCYGGYGCYGCYGGWSCYGTGSGCYGGGPYGPAVVPGGGMPGGGTPPEKLNPPNKQDSSRAKVIIDVPAQAKLFIDDQPMSNKTGQRTFVTPPLDRGQTYYYDVKIVLTVDGQEKVQTQRVILRAGDEVAANFTSGPNGTVTVQAKGR